MFHVFSKYRNKAAKIGFSNAMIRQPEDSFRAKSASASHSSAEHHKDSNSARKSASIQHSSRNIPESNDVFYRK